MKTLNFKETKFAILSTSNRDSFKLLPLRPGIYIFRNSEAKVLYIGKASKLRSRVRSYFSSNHGRSPWISKMVEDIAEISYIVTFDEVEALVLENNFIKEYKPLYNIQLRDGKSFPYLKFTTSEDFPRLMIVRRVLDDNNLYFGPFPSTSSLRRTVKFLQKTFYVRSCTGGIEDKTSERCIYFQMKSCFGPCDGLQTKVEYDICVKNTIDFLKGKDRELIKRLREEMEVCSEEMRFEKAASIRDNLKSIEYVLQNHKVLYSKNCDQDIIGFYEKSNRASFRIFYVRGGRLLGDQNFSFKVQNQISKKELISGFVKQYYNKQNLIPQEILLSDLPEDINILSKWLSLKKGKRVEIQIPKKGTKYKLLKMACLNALEEIESKENEESLLRNTLEEIESKLKLKKYPERIEAFDVSNLQGNSIVGASVAFKNGLPFHDDYRRYRIRYPMNKPDDFLSIKEIVYRRLKRLKNEGKLLPDLLLIDGGKGQLNAALEVLKKLNLVSLISVCSISKARGSDNRTDSDVIYIPEEKNPIKLNNDSDEKHLIQRIRDEVHRFAITYHRKERKRKNFENSLSDVKGLGPKKRRALIKKFSGVMGVSSATDEELLEVEGINAQLVNAIRDHLGESKTLSGLSK